MRAPRARGRELTEKRLNARFHRWSRRPPPWRGKAANRLKSCAAIRQFLSQTAGRRQGGRDQDQARSFLAGLMMATGRSVARQCGSTGDRCARLRPSSRPTARSSEASAGAARAASCSLSGLIRLVDRSRANRGIGADGEVADGEVVHPVGVRMRLCSKLEQSSSTGDVSTSSSV